MVILIDNIRQVGSYRPHRSAVIHNALVKGQTAYISYYELGLKVVDLSDPTNMREIASYNTYRQSVRGNMTGAWGVFPYHPDPTVVFISDMRGGLCSIRVP